MKLKISTKAISLACGALLSGLALGATWADPAIAELISIEKKACWHSMPFFINSTGSLGCGGSFGLWIFLAMMPVAVFIIGGGKVNYRRSAPKTDEDGKLPVKKKRRLRFW